jgi:hypothetical protein
VENQSKGKGKEDILEKTEQWKGYRRSGSDEVVFLSSLRFNPL